MDCPIASSCLRRRFVRKTTLELMIHDGPRIRWHTRTTGINPATTHTQVKR